MKNRFFLPVLIFLHISLFTACNMQSDEKKKNSSGETSLTSFYISKTPSKMKYAYGDLLDLEGLVVKAKYSDGTEKSVDSWSASPLPWTALTTPGSVTVTITSECSQKNLTG